LEDPIDSSSREIFELSTFLKICKRGLVLATKAQDMVHWEAEVKKFLDGEGDGVPGESEVKEAARLEEFAHREANVGFSFLYNLGVVKLWSIIENAIDAIVVRRLIDPAQWGDHDRLADLRGPLVDFARLSPGDQAAYLARALCDEVKAKFKLGPGRFEAMLTPVGLGGEIEDEVKRLILELQQVRHICVHNAGCVDERFIRTCAWLSLTPGEKLPLTEREFYSYALAVKWYLLEIRRRLLRPQETEELGRVESSKSAALDLLRDVRERWLKDVIAKPTEEKHETCA
jgi:hypothetical protein